MVMGRIARWGFLVFGVATALGLGSARAVAQVPLTCSPSRTFYIDFSSGGDTNGGSKTSPWKRQPYMSGWSGNYTHQAGDCFIFKGGVVWDHTTLPMAIQSGGTAANGDYYGVDKTWFAGSGTWTRPVLDAQSVQSTGVDIIDVLAGASNITIDNLELRGLWVSAAAPSRSIYLQLDNSNIEMQNLDVHNWRIDQAKTLDDQVGGIYNNADTGTLDGVNVDFSHIHNEDGGYMNASNTAVQVPSSGGVALRSIQRLSNNEIDHTSTILLHGGELVHDNNAHDIVSSYDPAFHTNNFFIDLWQRGCVTRPAFVYRNKVINSRANAAPIYPNPGSTASNCQPINMYVYDNLVYGGNPPYDVDVDNFNASPGLVMNVFVYNNTLQVPSTDLTGCVRGSERTGNQALTTFVVENNHCIFDGGLGFEQHSTISFTFMNNLTETNSQATTDLFTSNNGYAPPSPLSPTVRKGLDLSTVGIPTLDVDILSLPRPANLWDIGAYQQGVRPAPPTGLTATVR